MSRWIDQNMPYRSIAVFLFGARYCRYAPRLGLRRSPAFVCGAPARISRIFQAKPRKPAQAEMPRHLPACLLPANTSQTPRVPDSALLEFAKTILLEQVQLTIQALMPDYT